MLTPEIIEDFRRMLPTVLYLETVGDRLGIHRTTWRGWFKRGAQEARRLLKPRAKPRKSEALYLEFFDTHRKALADGETLAIQTVQKAAVDVVDDNGKIVKKGDWQAAQWLAERRYAKHWGKKDSLELKGSRKRPAVVTEVVVRSREEAEKVLAEMEGNGEARADREEEDGEDRD